jgi:hypothetical protein
MMGRGSVNVNSMNYISKYAKIITNDFSGSFFTDLSATPGYALTAGGLNMTDRNTTFSRLKYNNTVEIQQCDHENHRFCAFFCFLLYNLPKTRGEV